MDQDGNFEDLVHPEHLKPYFDKKEPEDYNETTDVEEDNVNARPREDEDTAMSDPLSAQNQPPTSTGTKENGASNMTLPRGRSQPRKTTKIVKRPVANFPAPPDLTCSDRTCDANARKTERLAKPRTN